MKQKTEEKLILFLFLIGMAGVIYMINQAFKILIQ